MIKDSGRHATTIPLFAVESESGTILSDLLKMDIREDIEVPVKICPRLKCR
jgi:hypothetical protein